MLAPVAISSVSVLPTAFASAIGIATASGVLAQFRGYWKCRQQTPAPIVRPPTFSVSMLNVHGNKKRPNVAAQVDSLLQRLSTVPQTEYQPLSKRLAAVLVPIIRGKDGSLKVLLTQRSERLRAYAGQVCLPGGQRDPEDDDDVACALREAHEEIGLSPESVKVLCKLPPVNSCAPRYYSVTPVLGLVTDDFVPTTNSDEVSSVFQMSLHEFLENSTTHEHRDTDVDGVIFRVHYFLHHQFKVWGMTASVLIKAAQAVFGESPAFSARDDRGLSFSKLAFDGSHICIKEQNSENLSVV